MGGATAPVAGSMWWAAWAAMVSGFMFMAELPGL